MALPDLAQHRDLRQPAQGLGCFRTIEPVEQREPVFADRAGVGLTFSRGLR
jgi:hypothetical protein